MEQIRVICGHYGTGKTNFALNIALDAAKEGQKVTLVDLDIVNPYFRSSGYAELLRAQGVNVISPNMAGTTLDAPGLSAGIFSVFDQVRGTAILDVGGDDAGATALGRFSARLRENGYEMLYVVNAYRAMVGTPERAVELLREIEAASRLEAAGIVNNSHLARQTTAQVVPDSIEYAQRTAALAGLPLVAHTVPRDLAAQLDQTVEKIYPIDIIVKLPWN